MANDSSNTNSMMRFFSRLFSSRETPPPIRSSSLDQAVGNKGDYICVYYFLGNTRNRVGIGHVALWDGEKYYSYPDQPKKGNEAHQWGLDNDNDQYGSCYKIMLPKTPKLLANILSVESSIENNWKPDKYHLVSRNCADMVRAYLREAGYPAMDYIVSRAAFIMTPSDVADRVRSVGKLMTKQVIEQERSQPRSEGEINIMRNYLRLFKLELDAVNLTGTLYHDVPTGIKTLRRMMKLADIEDLSNPEVVTRLYYDLKTTLARLHYSNSLTRSQDTHAFYSDWLEKSFDASKSMLVESRRLSEAKPVKLARVVNPQQKLNAVKKLVNSLDAVYNELGRGTHKKDIARLLDQLNQPNVRIEQIITLLESSLRQAANERSLFRFGRRSEREFVALVNDKTNAYHYPRLLSLMLSALYKQYPALGEQHMKNLVAGVKLDLDNETYKKLNHFVKKNLSEPVLTPSHQPVRYAGR